MKTQSYQAKNKHKKEPFDKTDWLDEYPTDEVSETVYLSLHTSSNDHCTTGKKANSLKLCADNFCLWWPNLVYNLKTT